MKSKPPILVRRKRTGDQNRTVDLCANLREMAVSIGPNNKLPTTRELCSMFSTSFSTVNSALQTLESQKIVFRRQGSGIFVSPRLNDKAVSLIAGTSFLRSRWSSPFWDNLLAMCIQESQNRVANHNERLTVYIATSAEAQESLLPENFIHDYESRSVHGVIGISLDFASSEWLRERNIPMAAFGGGGWPQVQIDERRLIQMGVEELGKAGCRRIGFWAPNPHDSSQPVDPGDFGNVSTVTREHAAFAEALAENALSFDPALIQNNRLVAAGGLTNQEQGVEMAERLLALPPSERPDGILIYADTMTAGVMAVLRSSDIKVGQDLKIATHANIGSQILYGYDRVLTQIAVDPMEIVRNLYDMLSVQMHGEPSFDPRLIEPRLLT